MLTLRGFLFLYFVICWFCSSGAQLNPPSDRLVFAPGEDKRIVWTYSGNINQVTSQTLSFTGASTHLVLVARGKVVDRVSNGLDFQFVLPLTLILKNVNQTYNGTYTMEVKRASGTLSSPVHVFIAVAPKISINCSSTTTLNVSAYFSCECKGVDGNPPAVVTWYKDRRRIISGEEMATLTIAGVHRDDNGLYRCEAKGDEKAKAEKTVQIIVNSEPFNTKLTLQREGDKATLTCSAKGNPPPRYEIFVNGSISVMNGSTLVINEVTINNIGVYTCRATNNLGSQLSQKVNLPLKGMSTTTSSPSEPDTKAKKGSEGGLGGGVIAGIVIGVLVVIIIIVVVVYFCLVKKNKDSRLGNSKSTAEYSKAADSADKDTHYAALDPVALNAGGSRPRADEPPPQTQYASIDHGATGSTKADLV